MSKCHDFGGWATKFGIRCSDGRVITKEAFKDCDGKTVPLVWNHGHNDPSNVLGHAMLKCRDEGIYAYGDFNSNPEGIKAKELVDHGDVTALSIYANHLKHSGSNVIHGAIREVSLVLAGANPGATIDSILQHSDTDEEDVIITMLFDDTQVIAHSDESDEDESIVHAESSKTKETNKEEAPMATENKERTIGEVFDEFTDEQKDVVYALVGMALDQNDEEGDGEMAHNIFDNEEMNDSTTLSHSEMQTIVSDARRCGSMRESFLEHAEEYGIQNLEYLFPDDRNVTDKPLFISRDTGWVSKVMSAVHHVPFTRIKSMFADITEDEARAKGYIKGKFKKEEVFSLLKRRTEPTTVYKKQKMDKDDQKDIVDFDMIAWLKAEMRLMLDEELARSYLIGDGRLASDEDKIDETRIRPVLNDHDLFVIRWAVASGADADATAKNIERAAIKARKNYKGSGNPTLWTTEDVLTDMLLREDSTGRKIYKTEAELATALRVKEIVTVPLMEGLKDKDNKDVYGIIVNMADYYVGADKGGSIDMFEDFDIDYNQNKYLIETRCSGALVRPFSAIVLRSGSETKSEEQPLADIKDTLDD